MIEENYEETFKVETPARLVVKNVRGTVSIKPGAEDEINILATKHLDSGNPENTEVILEQSQDGVVNAIAKYDTSDLLGFGLHRPCKVDFEITTPKACSVRLKTVSASSSAQGLEGDFRFKSVSGRLALEDLTGSIEANTVSGSLLANHLRGPAELESVSGKIEATDCDFSKLYANSVSGKITVFSEVGDGPYKFNTVSGRIKFIVPQKTACTISASSVSGKFKTDLNAKYSSIGRRNWHADLEGGGTEVRMKSVSGGLYLITSEDAIGQSPEVKPKSRQERIEILSKLESGEISVEDTLKELGT
jgi:DUF4097 and DUF4098 domain-containing protein YvlB